MIPQGPSDWTKRNQKNKALVWAYWQKLNWAKVDEIPKIIGSAFHRDVNWNGPHPINQLRGTDGLINHFWLPLLHSFPDLKRQVHILMGRAEESEEWVSGLGYLTGTFVHDWLGIPATNEKTHIHFGQYYRVHENQIVESYLILDLLAVMRQAGFQVLPPARGVEGGLLPGPHGGNGILLTEQDESEGRITRQLVNAMGSGQERYVRSRDGADLNSMEQQHYWDPQMQWYGPTGIGTCLDLGQFQDFHQRSWLHAFGDRDWQTLPVAPGARYTGSISEGLFDSGGVWDWKFSVNHGDYLGVPATGKMMTIRDFDWYKRDGDRLVQNWVPIDLIDLLRQMGVDLFDRLRHQVELRHGGSNWYDPRASLWPEGKTGGLLAGRSLRRY